MALLPVPLLPGPRDEDCETRPELTADELANLYEDPRLQLWPWIEWLTTDEIARLVWLRWMIAEGRVNDGGAR